MALADDLQAAWHFNDAGWIDSIGSNHGSPVGDPTFDNVIKKVGSHAAALDGTDYLNVGNNSVLNPTDAFTVGWFQYVTNTNQNAGIIYRGNLAGNQGNYNISHQGSGRLGIILNNGAFVLLTSTGIFTSGAWQQLVVSYDKNRPSNQVRVYCDGVYIKNGTYTASLQQSANNNYIGNYFQSQELTGNLDAFHFWDRAITDGDISLSQAAGGEVNEFWNDGSGVELGAAAIAAGRRRKMLIGRN